MGCSNRSWSSMWLDWSFNQASHCWLYGTFESSGSTQPHCRKGGLTLVTAAGTAQPSQAQLCLSRCHVLPSVPAGKLCWTLSPPELAGARCSSGVSGLICWLWVWHHQPWGILGEWITPLPTGRPHWISVKASLIHNGITLRVIFPPIMTPHFPEGMKEYTVSDRSLFPLWTDPAQQVLHHYPKYSQETDRQSVNVNNPLLHTPIGKVLSLSCNTVLSLFAFVFSHPPSYGVHIPSPETETANQ